MNGIAGRNSARDGCVDHKHRAAGAATEGASGDVGNNAVLAQQLNLLHQCNGQRKNVTTWMV